MSSASMSGERPSIKDGFRQVFAACFSTVVVILGMWVIVLVGEGLRNFKMDVIDDPAAAAPNNSQTEPRRANSRLQEVQGAIPDSNYGGSSMLRKENREALKEKLQTARDRGQE
ncbi:MAG: hypothetical protein RLY93_08775 [Sumerlaeia bacterium]